MTSFLVHGLWLKSSGLHLWIEQVEGHKVVLFDALPPDVLPPALETILRDKVFRHRVKTTLMTPKGRVVSLSVPTASFTPEQAVRVLAQLATINSTTATQEQLMTIGADLQWLVHMYQGLLRMVRAGRVLLKMSFADGQWWPNWQLSTGLGERGWIAQMTAAAPGILIKNGGQTVAEDIADELTHWIANSLLSGLRNSPRATKWHDFSRALLDSTPLRRGSAQLVGALNDWKNSITTIDIQLVLIVEEPPTDHKQTHSGHNADDEVVFSTDPADAIWPIRVQVRSGVDSPLPIKKTMIDRATWMRLEALLKEAILVAPEIDPQRSVPSNHPAAHTMARYSLEQMDSAGEWDAYVSTAELIDFVAKTDALARRGIMVMLPKTWGKPPTTARLVVDEPSDNVTGARIGLDQIVEYNWRVSIGDVELNDEEMRQLVQSKSGLIQLRGQWVMADAATAKRVGEYMTELAATSRKKRRKELDQAMMQAALAKANNQPDWQELAAYADELAERFNNEYASFGEVSLADLREIALKALEEEPIEFTGSSWQASMMGGIHDLPAPEPVEIPDSVHAELRDYQRRGVDWLAWMSAQNLGAVLADDMGLGKTLQLLTLEAVERTAKISADKHTHSKPTLVVAPTSVVGNWAREAGKFVPDLRILVHHGGNRNHGEKLMQQIENHDIVITSYGTIQRDHKQLAAIEWERVVLDEAQQIKNSSTKVSKAVRSVPSRHRIALTGTPVENRLSEMRSILDFCNPGVLGSATFFRHHFAKAIEREHDEVMTERLRRFTAPFILRRLKSDPTITVNLPDKTETILTVDMTPEQAALYTAYVEGVKQQLEQAQGIAKRGVVLAALTKIKQICNHPAHFLGDGSALTIKGKHRSGKVEELMRLINDAQEVDDRILVFTQYRAFGDLLAQYLSEYFGQKIPFLHGGVSKTGRDRMVEKFQNEADSPVMVLSLKAGGTGLNLTAANIVVHMDRWWNPAVENQATDRAYRIGQNRNVQVYKMITAGTMEESIQDILDGKTELASAIVGEGEGWITELSTQELAMLMSYKGRDAHD
ncbi:DEAD/DEAH box helicase [Corynebacterium kutscheri]|uniref:DNA/RNA helicase, superfamily II, SNF2 family n=1 Tax=Corynebacterium kutscheri TaxID=35755 RepID=A0A0F6R2I0_9CORY|nr:DEAD/DEAH box helicase [Corynebacterium kutscheri]AKE41673.1 DNA/RNA helicase, superfamily II, SNF2 family [Corynebacterium kutscheri]VEH08949.1 Helicase helZ [Corynebacterium kutscheri]VEH10000.1 Helicase helZ [Corynebacterium kutscheri]